MPNQIHQAIHAALPATTFLVKPFLAQAESMANCVGLRKQFVGFSGRVENSVFRLHHKQSRPRAPRMPAKDLHAARVQDLEFFIKDPHRDTTSYRSRAGRIVGVPTWSVLSW
jgi:hypothetical protein